MNTPPAAQEATSKALDKYGVGACGPRAFYGTVDVHLILEQRLKSFMGTEDAIIYSYDTATMPSLLPAFASRKDVIVIDEQCPWPQRNGAMLSRAQGAPSTPLSALVRPCHRTPVAQLAPHAIAYVRANSHRLFGM
jgi:7-keto-8-aminopelargonate synthetase-like enzyme